MKQSSLLKFEPFDGSFADMFGGAVPFCPNTKGAEPLVCASEEDSCFFLIDRRGYTVVFVFDGHGDDTQEWFLPFEHYGEGDDALAYWPLTPNEARSEGWFARL